MRWLVAGLALLGGLAGGALGIYLAWIGSDLAGFLGGQTWSSHAGELFDASAVWLWRIRSIRIALLLVAVEARDAEMAELLVRSAADPYEVGPSGRSPMALSIAQGSTAVTERMLSTVLAMDDVRRRRVEE